MIPRINLKVDLFHQHDLLRLIVVAAYQSNQVNTRRGDHPPRVSSIPGGFILTHCMGMVDQLPDQLPANIEEAYGYRSLSSDSVGYCRLAVERIGVIRPQ